MSNQVKQLTLSAFFLALGLVLPFAFHSFGPQAGTVFLPMHIPVLLCGFVCGPAYGALVGMLTPLLSSALTDVSYSNHARPFCSRRMRCSADAPFLLRISAALFTTSCAGCKKQSSCAVMDQAQEIFFPAHKKDTSRPFRMYPYIAV